MVSKHTKRVGLVIPGVSNEYWAQLVEIIQDRLTEYGYNLILCCSRYSLEVEEQHLATLRDGGTDGVICCPTCLPSDNAQFFQWLKTYPKPIIMLDRKIPGFSQVVADHFDGAVKATEHLIQQGHTAIAHIGGPLASPDQEQGFRFAHEKHNLPVDEALMFQDKPTVKLGLSAIQSLVSRKKSFSAVYCGNDMITLGVLNALKQIPLRVPEDIAVVGYDDFHISPFFLCPLTSIQYPLREMGKRTVDLLLEMIHEKETSPTIHEVTFPASLTIRASSGSN